MKCLRIMSFFMRCTLWVEERFNGIKNNYTYSPTSLQKQEKRKQKKRLCNHHEIKQL